MDNHTVRFERKTDLVTCSDRIIGFFYRRNMPVRKSYMYCDALDMTFFYDQSGNAIYTYAGKADERDSGVLLVNAFSKAEEIRKEMQKAIKEVNRKE